MDDHVWESWRKRFLPGVGFWPGPHGPGLSDLMILALKSCHRNQIAETSSSAESGEHLPFGEKWERAGFVFEPPSGDVASGFGQEGGEPLRPPLPAAPAPPLMASV